MPKGGKTADFKKRKQKLGKKKLAPTSTTATQFKTRSVVLLEQAQFADGRDTQPTTSRGSHTLPELLAQLRHYSPDVRRDALLGLNDLLHDHPSLLHTHAAEVLSGAAPLRKSSSLPYSMPTPVVSYESYRAALSDKYGGQTCTDW